MSKQAAQLLAQHFDAAFAVPDGIKKLRELILTLAMQGKLVPQDAKDQPANELLKAIAIEKRRLVKEGAIRVSKPSPPKLTNSWRVVTNWKNCVQSEKESG